MSFWPREGGIVTPQDIEDLATAAWLSETLFAALELGVFEALGEDALTVDELAHRCDADHEGCGRFVQALASLGLLTLHERADTGEVVVACSTVARRHLLRGAPGYLGDSLAYRRRLAGTWSRLGEAVRRGGSPLEQPAHEDEVAYRARVRDYLLAMDDVARHKAGLIAERLDMAALAPGCLLDLGGGAGAVAAELLRRNPEWRGLVLDMPEVVELACEELERSEPALAEPARQEPSGYASTGSPLSGRLSFTACNLLDEEIPAPPEGGTGWGLVVASNVVHAYSHRDSGPLLDRAARALSDTGLLLIHDFFTDGAGRGPVKSALFDLHMMINTYQGRTYPWQWVRDRLESQGLVVAGPIPLGVGFSGSAPSGAAPSGAGVGDEDTVLMAAARTPEALSAVRVDRLEVLDGVARDLGFRRTTAISPEDVTTAPWVEVKCRFGCAGYGTGGQCPPRSPRADETRTVLASYTQALLVEGEPPTAEFHRRMLALERAAFLGGAPQALAFVAGPCRLCPDCDPDECRHPAEARPSMEAGGMDVYATAATVGWRLEPVPDRESPATYVGLLLVG
ncbi:MAG: hypothetical protein KKA32_00835 [Actinobacteria bacterium]|nr:hypothetical protein [Actinomycetota bacterium]